MKGEADKMIYKFERDLNRDFANKYEECKEKCTDPKFEKFYMDFIYGTHEQKRKHPH